VEHGYLPEVLCLGQSEQPQTGTDGACYHQVSDRMLIKKSPQYRTDKSYRQLQEEYRQHDLTATYLELVKPGHDK